jgi:hypothetical protein
MKKVLVWTKIRGAIGLSAEPTQQKKGGLGTVITPQNYGQALAFRSAENIPLTDNHDTLRGHSGLEIACLSVFQ